MRITVRSTYIPIRFVYDYVFFIYITWARAHVYLYIGGIDFNDIVHPAASKSALPCPALPLSCS